MLSHSGLGAAGAVCLLLVLPSQQSAQNLQKSQWMHHELRRLQEKWVEEECNSKCPGIEQVLVDIGYKIHGLKSKTVAYRMMSEVFCANRTVVECASQASECVTAGETDPLQSGTGDSFMSSFMSTLESPITTTTAPQAAGLASMLCLCDCPMLTNFVTEIMFPSRTGDEILTQYVCPIIDEIPTCVNQHDSCSVYKAKLFRKRMIQKMKQKCKAYATECTEEWMGVRIANCTSSSIVSRYELNLLPSCSAEALAGSLNSSISKEACCIAAKGATTCLSSCLLDITAVSHSGNNEYCADSKAADATFQQVCPDSGFPTQEEVASRIEVSGLPDCTDLTLNEKKEHLMSQIEKFRNRTKDNGDAGSQSSTTAGVSADSQLPTTTATATSTVLVDMGKGAVTTSAVAVGAQSDSGGTRNGTITGSKIGKGSALVVGIGLASGSGGSAVNSNSSLTVTSISGGGPAGGMDSAMSEEQDYSGCADLFIEGATWYEMWSDECKSGCQAGLTCAAGCSTCYVAADNVCMPCTNSGNVMDQQMCEDHFPQGEWCNITTRVAFASASRRQNTLSHIGFAIILALLVLTEIM